jgi:hypothetical protein
MHSAQLWHVMLPGVNKYTGPWLVAGMLALLLHPTAPRAWPVQGCRMRYVNPAITDI